MDDWKQDFNIRIEQMMKTLLDPTVHGQQRIDLSPQSRFPGCWLDPATIRRDAQSHHFVSGLGQSRGDRSG
jgi:hypothetical protein